MFLASTGLGTIGWIMIVGWSLIFIVTLIIEIETADLVTIWFCISSFIVLILAIIGINPYIQIGVFVLLSTGLLFATKPLTKNMMKREIIRTNADRLIGMIGIVTKEIVPDELGEVKVDNGLWRAINNNGLRFEVGERVSIDAIVGIKLVVSKVEGQTNIEIL
jgi:membrane protein implicated in regulation of membrane protease activity